MSLLPLQYVVKRAHVPAHTPQKGRCVSRHGALPDQKKKPIRETLQNRREKNRSGTKQAHFGVFSSGSLGIFPVN